MMILFLGLLLAIGVFLRDFSIQSLQIVGCFAAALFAQAFWIQLLRIPQIGFQSALITALGLSLLLRSDNLWVHPLVAILAISSKFVLRFRSKHFFNPANFGLCLALLFFPGSWISPGQWGSEWILGVWFLFLGLTIVQRSKHSIMSLSFIAAFSAFLIYRILHFGYRWPVLENQLLNGSLLLFTFFMISDPKTAPNHWAGKIFHSVAVAVFAYVWQFFFYRQAGFIWGLFFLAPLVPIWDFILKASAYQWQSSRKDLEDDFGAETNLA